jgi:hypothetical protein
MLMLTLNKNFLPSPLLLLGSGADGLFGSKFTHRVPVEVSAPLPVPLLVVPVDFEKNAHDTAPSTAAHELAEKGWGYEWMSIQEGDAGTGSVTTRF